MQLVFLMIFSIQPIQVNEFVLENGLKILVYEDHFAPVVAVQVYYRVGSYNETGRMTGISHLLEHMAFKGTKKYKSREYDRIIDDAGGESNAYTSVHRTCYWANLYKDRYYLELELEADRMQNLLIAPEVFLPEKDVVMEERRLNENDPYGSLFEMLGLTTYTSSPYRNPVIGFMDDLKYLDRDNVYDWYRRFYDPANALIVISGDVVTREAVDLVKKYYGKIKGKKQMERAVSEPPQDGERRFELRKDVMSAAFAMNFRTVQMGHEDACVLDVISRILSRGSSSRFERIFIREKGIAASLYAYSSLSKYGGDFTCFAIPQPGVDIKDLEREIIAEFERLKTEDVTDAELNKAKNQVLAQTVFRQDSPAGIAHSIGSWELEGGGWQNINRYPEELQEVTKEDIRRVALKYFGRDNRTIGYLLPGEEK